MKLTDREWKEFNISQIFEQVQRGKRLTKANQIIGTKPYVSSTAMNNGVDNFISNNKNIRQFSNCITIANSGSVGVSFYHPYYFIASDHVTQLKNSSFNKNVYLFISTVTNRLSEKYNFNREINDLRIKRDKILLPINNSGEPDYIFMEDYVKFQELQKKQEYIKYAQKMIKELQYKKVPPIDEKEWGEFGIGGENGIFNIMSGKRLVKTDMSTGNIPFIGATSNNNGITGWTSTVNETLDSNILGVNYDGSVVESFYHRYQCIFSDSVKRLHLKQVQDNQFILLFIKTAILKQKIKYTYGYKFNSKRMERQKILIPLDQNNNPDYAYMEQYIKNIMLQKYKAYLKHIGAK